MSPPPVSMNPPPACEMQTLAGLVAALVSALVSWSKLARYEANAAQYEVAYLKFGEVAQVRPDDRTVST
eukprot:609035-Prorocentrum_minimum.AAC.1